MAFGQGAKATLVGVESSTGGAETVDVPVGTTEGDLVVMGVQTVNSVPNVAGPSGGSDWNELYRFDSASNEYHAIYWKVCGASEPASWGLTQSGGEMSIGVAVFRNAGNALYGFTGSDNQLTAGWIPAHPLGLQVLVYLSHSASTLSPPLTATTAIWVAPETQNNAQVIIAYRDTTWVGDGLPIRCGGVNANTTGAMNMVFYPS